MKKVIIAGMRFKLPGSVFMDYINSDIMRETTVNLSPRQVKSSALYNKEPAAKHMAANESCAERYFIP